MGLSGFDPTHLCSTIFTIFLTQFEGEKNTLKSSIEWEGNNFFNAVPADYHKECS